MSYMVCTGQRVLLNSGIHPATFLVDKTSGKISEIQLGYDVSMDSIPVGALVEHLNGRENIILPGLVDTHVHLNEPGRTHWEGFYTGTRAAAAGGVTTVVDMPLNSIPPTTTVENLNIKRAAAQGQCVCDVAFWGGAIPGNQVHLKPLVQAGVKGFKCFLIDSGVEEFPCVSEADLRRILKELEGTDTVLLFHAELDTCFTAIQPGVPTQYTTFLASRPQSLEFDAISLIISLLQDYPSVRCHIVHLSAASAIPLIREAKASGLNLTVETCFHYLCLSADAIPDGRPDFKCCPPIRDTKNCNALWDALKEGVIDFVVSDHSPCSSELKKMDQGDIMAAWGGISSLGLGLSLLWTEGKKHGVDLKQILEWVSKRTAVHVNLDGRKGQLAEGFDADFVLWDPDAVYTIANEGLHVKNKLSPFEGANVCGKVAQTYLRGNLVYDEQTGFGPSVGIML